MLPSEKAELSYYGQIALLENGKLHRAVHLSPLYKLQHLYIISDEPINEGDYWFDGTNIRNDFSSNIIKSYDKKIVVTTDKSLGNIYSGNKKAEKSSLYSLYSFPSFNDSFIKAYVKAYNEGKQITEVDLEMEKYFEYDLQNPKLLIKTRVDNTVIIHKSETLTREQVKELMIKKLKSLMPKYRNKFGDKFTGTDICDAIEFGTESQLNREKLILQRAINEIDLFLDENI